MLAKHSKYYPQYPGVMRGSQEGKRSKLWGPLAHFGANISMKIVERPSPTHNVWDPPGRGGRLGRMEEQSPSPSNPNPVYFATLLKTSDLISQIWFTSFYTRNLEVLFKLTSWNQIFFENILLVPRHVDRASPAFASSLKRCHVQDVNW